MRAFAFASALLVVLPALASVDADVVHADPAEPLEGGVILIYRATDRGRWEAGAGAASGWRPLLDFHARYYVSDTVTAGTRLRLDLDDAAPRALDFEVGKAIGVGKLRFPGDVMTRARLVFAWGSSAVRFGDVFVGSIFAGLALHLQPSSADWLSIELGLREAWAPSVVPAAAARAMAEPMTVELSYGLATELGASVAVLWPRARRECVTR
jgi:hypothetical protein